MPFTHCLSFLHTKPGKETGNLRININILAATDRSKKELFAKKVVSEFDLRTAENSWLTAKAQLAQAKAQEVSARNDLSYTEVKSRHTYPNYQKP